MLLKSMMHRLTCSDSETNFIFSGKKHGDVPYRILVVRKRILFMISGLCLCKRVYVGRGKYLENHFVIKTIIQSNLS